MKKYLIYILISILLITPFSVHATGPSIDESQNNKVKVYLFHSKLCQHCQKEMEFLNELKNKQYFELITYEINDKENAKIMDKVKEKMKVKNQQVPFTIIGSSYYIGFSDTISNSIETLIDNIQKGKEESPDVVGDILNDKDISNISIKNGEISEVVTPFGTFNPHEFSLPILTIILGAIDGFNPCAMWVLIFLITMLMNMHNKKRMWMLGITFLTASAGVYLLFMLAWLKVVGSLASIVWFRLFIAVIALISGAINLNSYFKSRKKDSGCEVVDEKKRKKLITKIKKITTEKSFILALIGVIVLAVSVNVIELACSAGIPLIFTQILALSDLSSIQYILYILLYIFFFLIDDIIVFTVAMITLNISGISTKYTKYTHLIGGIIMLLIGLLMIFKPEWLMLNI